MDVVIILETIKNWLHPIIVIKEYLYSFTLNSSETFVWNAVVLRREHNL